MANAATCAPVKARLRNSPSGSIGSFTRASTAMKATRKAAAPTSAATIGVLVQPSSLPRSSASTSRNRPAVSVTWPGMSSLRASGSLDSSTKRRVIARHMRPSGRLTMKIQRQSRPLVSAPPTSGPMAKAAPIEAP